MERDVMEVLAWLYPDREAWSQEEVAAARRVLTRMRGSSSAKSSRAENLPTKFIPVGGRVVRGGSGRDLSCGGLQGLWLFDKEARMLESSVLPAGQAGRKVRVVQGGWRCVTCLL